MLVFAGKVSEEEGRKEETSPEGKREYKGADL